VLAERVVDATRKLLGSEAPKSHWPGVNFDGR
jgi:hypothetical protein